MVPGARIELARCRQRGILNPVCLPNSTIPANKINACRRLTHFYLIAQALHKCSNCVTLFETKHHYIYEW